MSYRKNVNTFITEELKSNLENSIYQNSLRTGPQNLPTIVCKFKIRALLRNTP